MGMKFTRKQGPAAERLELGLKALKGIEGRVGYFETSRYPNGMPVAAVAAIQELGAPSRNIPPRPTMRPTATAKRSEWGALTHQGAKAVLNGTATAEDVMNALGAKASGDIAKAIATLTNPPLKASTIKARQRRYKDRKTVGSLTKPLVDTAIMINSLTWQVSKRGS